MRGEVLIPFIATLEGGRKVRPAQGQIIEIPPNVDWVQAGFVQVLVGATDDEDTAPVLVGAADEDTAPVPKTRRKKVSDDS